MKVGAATLVSTENRPDKIDVNIPQDSPSLFAPFSPPYLKGTDMCQTLGSWS